MIQIPVSFLIFLVILWIGTLVIAYFLGALKEIESDINRISRDITEHGMKLFVLHQELEEAREEFIKEHGYDPEKK